MFFSKLFRRDNIIKHLPIRKLPKPKHRVENPAPLQKVNRIIRKLAIKKRRFLNVPVNRNLFDHVRSAQSKEGENWNQGDSKAVHHCQASYVHNKRIFREKRNLRSIVRITVIQGRILFRVIQRSFLEISIKQPEILEPGPIDEIRNQRSEDWNQHWCN